MYSILRPLLFKLDPEKAHALALKALNGLSKTPFSSCLQSKIKSTPRQVMGIEFPNPVGLAAGLDKNAEYIDALTKLGFGFIEIGTLTLKPQPGNPQPRLFRIPEREAIINRMGFNNKGIDYALDNIRAAKFRGVLGINIGKNFDTPLEEASDEYVECLEKIYTSASYVVINISSPNTQNLRDLQQDVYFDSLLDKLKSAQAKLAQEHCKYIPLVIKIAPDLTDEEIRSISQRLLKHEIDGVIATNTSISRVSVEDLAISQEKGGLSGKPIADISLEVIKKLSHELKDRIPIIGVGGIYNAESARQKIAAGAKLVQIYTGLIYQGPKLIRNTVDELA